MILNVTYPSPKDKRDMAKVVGPSYNLMERIKMGGIGTSKLTIIEATEPIHNLLTLTGDTTYCHLECRKKGLIVGFQTTMKIYVWLIPYYQLSVYYNSGQMTIYGPKNSIKVKAPFNGSIDKKFIRKLLGLKSSASPGL